MILSAAFLAPIFTGIPSAEAAACAVTSGTVSGTTRYAVFNSGSACTWSVPTGVTSISYLTVGGGGGGGRRRGHVVNVPLVCGAVKAGGLLVLQGLEAAIFRQNQQRVTKIG